MDWEYLFSSRVLERGYQYYKTGAVFELEKTSTGYSAYVEGTYDYLVEIDFSNGEIESMSCSCPYADDGNHCKHMAAVLYELEEGGYDLPVDTKPMETLEQAVDSLSEAEAKRLLQLLGESDSDIRMRILQFSTAKVSTQQENTWEQYLLQLTRSATGRSEYIDYDRAFEYFCELSQFLAENIPMLLERGLAMEAFRLICRVCDLADGQDFDDSDGGFSMLLEECDAWWCDAIDVASEDQREEMYRWFATSSERSYLDYTKERLFEVQVDAFHDEKFLRENLELVDRLLTDGDLDYPMGELVLIRLRLMKKLSVPEEEISVYRRAYRMLPEVWNLELLK